MKKPKLENLTAEQRWSTIEKVAEHEAEINGIRAKRTTSDLLREYYEGKEQAYKEMMKYIKSLTPTPPLTEEEPEEEAPAPPLTTEELELIEELKADGILYSGDDLEAW